MIKATLNYIRWQGDGGFLIGLFLSEAEKGEFAALGNILRPEIGQTYKLFGEWVEDPKWGRQYKYTSYEIDVPKSTDGIYRYIVRIAKWVGPTVGKALVEAYKEDTLDVLRTDPDRVSSVIKGITLARAKEIQALIIENQGIEGALVELERLIGGQGLRKNLPLELVEKWGCDAPQVLKENPYRLIEMKQVGFPSADHIAVTRFGVGLKSIARQQAAVIHVLNDLTYDKGHVWIEIKDLLNACHSLLGYVPEDGFNRAIEKGHAVKDSGFASLRHMAVDEIDIADKVKEMLYAMDR